MKIAWELKCPSHKTSFHNKTHNIDMHSYCTGEAIFVTCFLTYYMILVFRFSDCASLKSGALKGHGLNLWNFHYKKNKITRVLTVDGINPNAAREDNNDSLF